MQAYAVLGGWGLRGANLGCDGAASCGCGKPRAKNSLGAMRYRRTLGALSPTDATNQIFPQSQITGTAGHNQAAWNAILASATAGQLIDSSGNLAYIPGGPDCKASGVSGGAQDLQLAGKAGSLALTGVTTGLVATNTVTAATLAIPTMGISIAIAAIVGIFSTILQHHAAAVAKEQSTLCSAVPAANNYLKIIAAAVSNGQATPQQCIDALNSLVTDFQSSVSSILQGSGPGSSGSCNAACVMLAELKAIVALMTSQFQDMINAAASLPAGSAAGAPITSGSGPTTAPVVASGATALIDSIFGTTPATAVPAGTVATASTLPSWLPIAALVVGGLYLAGAF